MPPPAVCGLYMHEGWGAMEGLKFLGDQRQERILLRGKLAMMALRATVAHLPANLRVGLEVLRAVKRPCIPKPHR